VRRVLIIVNPVSANGAAGRFWRRAQLAFAHADLDVTTVLTEQPGHAEKLAADAARDTFEVVQYVGGDGTANEVVNGLLSIPADARPLLACLPQGTGADLPRGLGLAPGEQAALSRLLHGKVCPLDAVHSSFVAPDGRVVERHFVNIADAGLGGYVAQHANNRTKALGGFASFLWAILTSFVSYAKPIMRITVDGEPRHEGRVTSAVVANGPYFGGGMHMAPGARSDDGLLEVVVIGDVGKRDLAANLHRLYRGTHLSHPKIAHFTGREVIVEGEGRILIEMDGEQPGQAPWHVRVVPGALRVLV
jgi:diacylglycerol kinase (ATP)